MSYAAGPVVTRKPVKKLTPSIGKDLYYFLLRQA